MIPIKFNLPLYLALKEEAKQQGISIATLVCNIAYSHFKAKGKI